MLIRSATAADVSDLVELERAAPSAAHWSRQQYEIAVGTSDRVTLVLEEGSTIKAFLIARILDHEWEIENVVVAGAQRRQGWGGRLMEEVHSRAQSRKAEAMFLEVRESNQAARSLYEKSGFAQVGRRPNYYHDPAEDALVYRRAVG